jgi:hypothetical protein
MALPRASELVPAVFRKFLRVQWLCMADLLMFRFPPVKCVPELQATANAVKRKRFNSGRTGCFIRTENSSAAIGIGRIPA